MRKECRGKHDDEDERADRRIELVSKDIDALTDDASKIAMDLGADRVLPVEGLTLLIETMANHLIPFKDDEVHELFHARTKTTGGLTRQRR